MHDIKFMKTWWCHQQRYMRMLATIWRFSNRDTLNKKLNTKSNYGWQKLSIAPFIINPSKLSAIWLDTWHDDVMQIQRITTRFLMTCLVTKTSGRWISFLYWFAIRIRSSMSLKERKKSKFWMTFFENLNRSVPTSNINARTWLSIGTETFYTSVDM